MRSPLLALPVLAVAALVAAGCGSSSNDSGSTKQAATTSSPGGASGPAKTSSTAAAAPSTAGRSLALSADAGGALRFDRSKLAAKAGTVTITMTNPSSAGIPHAIAVEGNGVNKDGATANPGGTSKVSLKLKPGTYTFFCPVDGHRQAGMQGTLVVR
jgi:plastocyanin